MRAQPGRRRENKGAKNAPQDNSYLKWHFTLLKNNYINRVSR
jgi:hypothetical protein